MGLTGLRYPGSCVCRAREPVGTAYDMLIVGRCVDCMVEAVRWVRVQGLRRNVYTQMHAQTLAIKALGGKRNGAGGASTPVLA